MTINITQQSLVACSQKQAFQIVSDVKSYPDFLPWCLETQIISSADDVIIADLTIGYKAFRHTYRSQVRCTPHDTIEVIAQDGPLQSLSTLWRFEPQSDHETLVHLAISFQLRSFLLERALGALIEGSVHKIAAAFQKRAQEFSA